MKKILLFALTLTAVFFCAVTASTADLPQKIVIGNPEALSGTHAKAGEQAIGGVRAIIKWVNTVHGGVKVGGKKLPLDYKYYDCESKKEAVTSLLERLITSDKVNFLLAPYSSPLTLAGAPVAEKYGILYMDHGGASDKIFEQGFRYVVQTIGPGTRYHVGTLDMLKKKDPAAKRLALAYKDDEFARSVMDGAEAHAKKLGYEIVFKRTYPATVNDLTPLLSDLKASKPDIVIGGGHLADGQLFTQQMADLGINPKALSLVAAVTLPAFHSALKGKANGVMGPSHWEYGVTFTKEKAQKAGQTWIGPSQEEFVKLFKEAIGKDLRPEYHAAEAGTAVLSLVLAVEKANSLDSDKVRAAMGDLKFTSFYGGWAIDKTGKQVGHDMIDAQWQNGNLVIVGPEAASTGALLYPKPAFK
ncbi:MAG: branched-chain amino acid transporter substrate-binding protein [Deltaproteobacteria bacterium]|nr:branched-chain amino acid transporter substrate-binding protein [Deltaproteobacteria bacterium]